MQNNIYGGSEPIKGTLEEYCLTCGDKPTVYIATFGNKLAREFQWFIDHQDLDHVAVIDRTINNDSHNSTWLSYFGLIVYISPNTWKLTAHGVAVAEGKEKVSKTAEQYKEKITLSKEGIFLKQAFGIKPTEKIFLLDSRIANEGERKAYCDRLKENFKK
jgi:hypothetical protein